MAGYFGSLCPHCQKELKETEEIVVCPVCGAPYHKSCYREVGSCLFSELHETGKNYEYQYPDANNGGEEEVRCHNCGTPFSARAEACPNCGTLSPNRNKEPESAPVFEVHTFPPIGDPNKTPKDDQTPFPPFVLQQVFSPFGGVKEDAEFEGVKANWLVAFLRQNPAYFMMRFARYAKKLSGLDINWSAVLFGPFYFLYRKMYLWALAGGGAYLLFWLPMTILSLLAIVNPQQEFYQSVGFELLMDGLWLACYGVRFLMGLFANRLYYRHCLKKISSLLSNKDLSSEETASLLAKKGGVSFAIPLLAGYLIGGLLSLAVQFLLPIWFPQLFEAIQQMIAGSTSLF